MLEVVGFLVTLGVFVLLIRGIWAFLHGSEDIAKRQRDFMEEAKREPRVHIEDAEISQSEREQAMQSDILSRRDKR